MLSCSTFGSSEYIGVPFSFKIFFLFFGGPFIFGPHPCSEWAWASILFLKFIVPKMSKGSSKKYYRSSSLILELDPGSSCNISWGKVE